MNILHPFDSWSLIKEWKGSDQSGLSIRACNKTGGVVLALSVPLKNLQSSTAREHATFYVSMSTHESSLLLKALHEAKHLTARAK